MTRGYYGQLGDDYAHAEEARGILSRAQVCGEIDVAYCDVDRKHRGSALSYDIYDYDWVRRMVLVQQRRTTCTKYGNTPHKSYLVLTMDDSGRITATCVDGHKASIVKLAKTPDVEQGDLIAFLLGEKRITIKTKSSVPRIAYKAVAIVDGRYLSIYNGATEYIVGKTLVQQARAAHGGGYYCYLTPQEAAQADVPEISALLSAERAVLRVEVSGTHIEYGNGKMAYTRLTPIAVEATI